MKIFLICLWGINMMLWIINAFISINNKNEKSIKYTVISASLTSAMLSFILLIDNI